MSTWRASGQTGTIGWGPPPAHRWGTSTVKKQSWGPPAKSGWGYKDTEWKNSCVSLSFKTNNTKPKEEDKKPEPKPIIDYTDEFCSEVKYY